MAFPFGSPTFASYLVWAAEAGCRVESGYGGPHGLSCTKITAPSGKSLVVPGMDQKERLVSSMLNYLDRRLGMRSPYDRVLEA